MKKITNVLFNLRFYTLLMAGLIISTTARADLFPASYTLKDVVDSINRLANVVNSIATAWARTNANLIYEDNPSLPATIVGNTAQTNSINSANAKTQDYSTTQIRQELTQASDLTKALSDIKASDTYVEKSSVASIFGRTNNTDLAQGNANFSSTSLLLPTAYSDTNAERLAKNFIYFAGGLGQPLTSLNWASLTDEQKQKLQDSADGQRYRVMLRSLIAARSVGINNLYSLLAERMPVEGLGTQAGLNTPNASPLQVKEYLATRRSSSPQWYADMAKASPAVVQRETLYVMAEMQRQLYDLHLDNQRILTTLSIMELQNIQFSKMELQQKEQALKSTLGIKDEGSTAIDTLNSGLNTTLPTSDDKKGNNGQ